MNPKVLSKIPIQVFSLLALFILLLNGCSTEVDNFITEQDERSIVNESFLNENVPDNTGTSITETVIDCNTLDFTFSPLISTNEVYDRFSRINLNVNQPNATGGFLVRLNKYISHSSGNMGELMLHNGLPAIRFSFDSNIDFEYYLGSSSITMPDLNYCTHPSAQSNNFILPAGTYNIIKEISRDGELIFVIDATNFTPGVFHTQEYWAMMFTTKNRYETHLYSGGIYDQNGFPPSLSLNVDQQTFNAEVFNIQIEFMADCGKTIIKKYDNQFQLL
jgi:hypothetical protein